MPSSLIIMLMYLFILFAMPVIVLLVVFATRAHNKRSFKKKFGCSPEYYKELKKLKELHECGILSAEEYEAKKKQILGL
ncbi:MAG: SHOCT domain-containing protein [Oscillospiraceae bacterium]|nr:SHOCT domain-containing protein [Oscillospiraceae bacterium]